MSGVALRQTWVAVDRETAIYRVCRGFNGNHRLVLAHDSAEALRLYAAVMADEGRRIPADVDPVTVEWLGPLSMPRRLVP